jgi:hypothetical protein
MEGYELCGLVVAYGRAGCAWVATARFVATGGVVIQSVHGSIRRVRRMTAFHTTMSFEIPVIRQRRGGRRVDVGQLKEFWQSDEWARRSAWLLRILAASRQWREALVCRQGVSAVVRGRMLRLAQT